MQAVVVYESIYGNTRHVAEAVARGLAAAGSVRTLPVSEAKAADLSSCDLLLVGGPTHVHGMSREKTRQGAVEAVGPDSGLTVEPDAESLGVREWLDALESGGGQVAAFDTRIDAPALVTERASKGIAKRLRRLGFELVADPESFLGRNPGSNPVRPTAPSSGAARSPKACERAAGRELRSHVVARVAVAEAIGFLCPMADLALVSWMDPAPPGRPMALIAATAHRAGYACIARCSAAVCLVCLDAVRRG